MNIVVVGFGWVGQANALALSKQGYAVSYFDPQEPPHHYKAEYASLYAGLSRLLSVAEKDSADTCYVICVGDRVSENGTQDISLIESALASVKNVLGTVIVRSTVLPHLLQNLSFDFYIPEFLHEKYAVAECAAPQYFVVGKKTEKSEPEFFQAWERAAYKTFRGTPEEASHIKYLSNLWNSVRIAFVNEFGDAIRTPKTKEDVAAIERVIDFMFDGKYYMRYGRSFGGHCLPKDTRAFVRAQKEKGNHMALLAGVYEANEKHQVYEKQYALPEWFSAWHRPVLSGRVALKATWTALKRRLTNQKIKA